MSRMEGMKRWMKRNARWLVATQGAAWISSAVWMMWELVPWWVAGTAGFGLLLLLEAWQWETTEQLAWLTGRWVEDVWLYVGTDTPRAEREWDENVGK